MYLLVIPTLCIYVFTCHWSWWLIWTSDADGLLLFWSLTSTPVCGGVELGAWQTSPATICIDVIKGEWGGGWPVGGHTAQYHRAKFACSDLSLVTRRTAVCGMNQGWAQARVVRMSNIIFNECCRVTAVFQNVLSGAGLCLSTAPILAMGGSLGCHRSIPKDPTDFSCGKRKFSAACNFSHILVNQERLNINIATEEELMTLPGVNRTVARNIVQYRDCIGGFKKVEDLALVSGVGATKLEVIKLEICVSSRTSSSQHSPSSLRKDLDSQFYTGMNINTATPAQLMSIRGITETIAKNVVSYRAEHGPFKSIEDLVKVKHINSSLLDKIRFQVFVERSRAPSTNTNAGLPGTTKCHPSPSSFSLGSDDLDLPPGGPTQIVSVRPKVDRPLGLRDGKSVVRVATWSLQGCSCDKANNPGVREVVCMTLLENEWVPAHTLITPEGRVVTEAWADEESLLFKWSRTCVWFLCVHPAKYWITHFIKFNHFYLYCAKSQ